MGVWSTHCITYKGQPLKRHQFEGFNLTLGSTYTWRMKPNHIHPGEFHFKTMETYLDPSGSRKVRIGPHITTHCSAEPLSPFRHCGEGCNHVPLSFVSGAQLLMCIFCLALLPMQASWKEGSSVFPEHGCWASTSTAWESREDFNKDITSWGIGRNWSFEKN